MEPDQYVDSTLWDKSVWRNPSLDQFQYVQSLVVVVAFMLVFSGCSKSWRSAKAILSSLSSELPRFNEYAQIYLPCLPLTRVSWYVFISHSPCIIFGSCKSISFWISVHFECRNCRDVDFHERCHGYAPLNESFVLPPEEETMAIQSLSSPLPSHAPTCNLETRTYLASRFSLVYTRISMQLSDLTLSNDWQKPI